MAPGNGTDLEHLVVMIFIIAIALVFDFINGFHDSANSTVTLVSTRVLSPRYAVLWAAFFNFVAIGILGLRVANTIATKIVDPSIATNEVVFAALMGAIAWNLITWYFGIPSSSSHALIGGFVGAGLSKGGLSVVQWGSLEMPLLGIILAPTLCLGLGYMLMVGILWGCRNMHPSPVNKAFKLLQFPAAAIYSIAHGGNDAQKTIGIICALLVGEKILRPANPELGVSPSEIPLWIVLAAYLAIGLGTLSGGWRIVKTMGSKITKLRPVDGFAAATSSGISIIGFTLLGLPVSTTHSIAGSIMGVGATRGLAAVKWGMSAQIVWAWIITIPASAALSAFFYWMALLGVKAYRALV